MKILIDTPNEGWILDKIAKEYQLYSSHDVWLEPDYGGTSFDCQWINSPRFPKYPFIPAITTLHHIVPDKFDINEFRAKLGNWTKAIHVPNEITCEQLLDRPESDGVYGCDVIPYWIDLNKFPCKERKKNNVLTIGSFQRDTEGSDLKSPKLEKGPDILIDILKGISKYQNIHVILAGWRRQYVVNRLDELDISYEYREKCDDDILVNLYHKVDLYLSCGRYEGGPQSILECSSTKTPILSTPVGIAPEILDVGCLCADVDHFIKKIMENVAKDYVDVNYNNIQKYNIKAIISQYDDMFSRVFR